MHGHGADGPAPRSTDRLGGGSERRSENAVASATHRGLDLALASALLILAGPVLVAAAVAVRLDSPGPALFRQTRLGRGGRPFRLLKLRTMYTDADSGPHRDHVRQLIRGAERRSAWMPMDDDPRVTRVGRVLRRTAVDELPQLVNVLRGEMSLVGPRPATPYEAEMWTDWHRRRLDVRPGITGLWQVQGRGAADFDTMVRLDLAYIARRSPALDLAILARTPRAVLFRRDTA